DRIVRARRPGRTAAVLGRRRRIPRLEACLARRWDGVERPEDLAGLGVEGHDAAVDTASVGTGGADDDLAVGEDRTRAEAFRHLDLADLSDPLFLAGRRVHRVHAAVAQRAVDVAFVDDRA